MTYGEVLNWLTAFFGVTSAFAYLHQAYWIWKRKSSADVSLFTFSYFFMGQLAFFLYGLHSHQINIIATFLANMCGSGLVIVLVLRFRSPGNQVISTPS